MLKSFRFLLIPVALVYQAVVWLRNWLYDKKIIRSASFNFPLICVGNLAMGGTGKTPMVEYLVRLLKHEYRTATLSRGYKRKTTGYTIAHAGTTALEIGDEPMQFHQKFPDIAVAVGEERLVAIPQLLHDRPDTQVIILDDAFQHRAVRAGLNILLTEQGNLYTRDIMLPAGDLRDVRSSNKRAQIIVVTKCKPGIGETEKNAIIKEIKPSPTQRVFFTEVVYSMPYHLYTGREIDIHPDNTILLVCGIANPGPLKEFLAGHVAGFELLGYRDHHIFNSDDLKDIIRHFTNLQAENKLILTTEKDAVRLHKFEKELKDFPIYVLPIQHSFLFNEGQQFNQLVKDFVNSFTREGTGY